VTTGRYGETYVGYRDYAQSTSLNFERTAYCSVQFQISEIGAGLGRLDLNLQSSISAKPAARKTKKTRAIGLSAAAHIWSHVDAVESMGGGGSIMWSALLRRAGAFSRMLHASTLERIFVVREMQALFENKMLDFG
jgi:hypothetical protein